ncbi:hypothetical protein PFISCL1PPCAC_23652 [Pristionchus fissidentatus]|uniref:Metalloendopeptidase n=1 Tax=Pristionchus fissidentatus TaxID=1538716 RepID=A0AAV5WP99_9BILA|nr:hypothetical protein PFISCL1PPCAC_23652 [Pristionchus fissidentatus]
MRPALLLLLAVVTLIAAQEAARREPEQRAGRGRGKGWKRSRAIDKAHAFSNLRRFGKGSRQIRTEDWKEHADQFCSLFPHHGKCKDGARPKQGDLSNILKAVERRQNRRRVPRMKKRDWLEGVPESLRERSKDRAKSFGRFNKEWRNLFKNSCKSGKVDCRSQPKEAAEKRRILRDELAKVEREELKVDDETADDNVEIRFDRTLRIKRALLEKANLTAEVDPIDDGIFEQDILLTEVQSNMILNDLDKAETTGDEDLSPDEDDEVPKAPTDAPSDPTPAAAAETSAAPAAPTESAAPAADSSSSSSDSSSTESKEVGSNPVSTPPPSVDGQPTEATEGTRKKRSGVFLEQNFAEKWDISSPIPYTFDSSIAPWDKTDVHDALDEISRVSCVRFRELSSAPNFAHINFVKIDSPTFCGLSYVGRVAPVNTVYLSFQCGKNVGVVVHEVMHALGIIHQHLRVDRDQFIKVDWSNVNPQKYDQFATADQSLYTSYGIKYSYDSIMHYNAYTNAVDTRKPTMIPLVNSASNLALLGQRDRMSPTDINLINKMYCKPASCSDTNIYCGHWALTGTCTLQGNSVWMSQNCRKSCNLC